MTDPTHVRIRLPLPVDVAATLTDLIAAAYPGAQLEMPDYGDGREIHVTIPAGARAKRVAKRTAAAARHEAIGDPMDVTDLSPTTYALSTPPQLAEAMRQILEESLAAHPAATNYLEFNLKAPGGPAYVMTFARSKGQTPAALRQAAEARAEAAEEAVRWLALQLSGETDNTPQHIAKTALDIGKERVRNGTTTSD